MVNKEDLPEEVVLPRRLDGLEAAIQQGKVVDSNFQLVKPDKDLATQPSPHILDDEEQRGHKGELKAGQIGWLELDEKGSPVGGATRFPKKDVPMAPVSTVVETRPTVLATPAGAFLTEGGMNPSPASYKYNSSAYNRDYAPFAKRSLEKWGISEEGQATGAKAAPAHTPPTPPRPGAKAA
jgi:hypothetical protein